MRSFLPERFRVGYAFGGTGIDCVRSPAMGGETIPEKRRPGNLSTHLISDLQIKPCHRQIAHL